MIESVIAVKKKLIVSSLVLLSLLSPSAEAVSIVSAEIGAHETKAEPADAKAEEVKTDEASTQEEQKVSLAEYYNPSNKSTKQKILGVEREMWVESLSEFKQKFEPNFLDNIYKYADALRKMRDADHFKRLGSDDDEWRLRKKKRRRYATSLDLTKSDFARTIRLIAELQPKIPDNEIEQYVPYVALCLSEGMRFVDVAFYIHRDVSINTPIDISKDRLYRELKIELGEI